MKDDDEDDTQCCLSSLKVLFWVTEAAIQAHLKTFTPVRPRQAAQLVYLKPTIAIRRHRNSRQRRETWQPSPRRRSTSRLLDLCVTKSQRSDVTVQNQLELHTITDFKRFVVLV